MKDSEGNIAICVASQQNSISSIRVLLQANANVHVTQQHNKTALHIACEWGQLEAAKVLLTHNKSLLNTLDIEVRSSTWHNFP